MSFTLQILHYYGESGLLGVKTAPIMGALIDKFDDQYANTIKIAEGDTFIPGPWLVGGADPSLSAVAGIGSTALGRPDIAIMNAFGTTVSALGNHEFDLGSPVFAAAINAGSPWVGAQFAYISNNLNVSADSSLRSLADKSLGGTSTNNYAGLDVSALKGKIAPYAISTVGGEKIGFVGATTYELLNKSSPNGTVTTGLASIDDSLKIPELALVIQASIDALIAAGVNKIIMVDQLDTLARNKLLAPLLSGVDVVVAGGSHDRLVDSTDKLAPFNGHDATPYPDGSYPIVATGKDGKPTLIVTTDTEFSYLGRLVVDFDANGEVVLGSLNTAINGAYASTEATLQAAYGTTQTAAQIVASSTIGSQVNAISTAINNVIIAKDSNIFGYTNVYMEGDRVYGRAQEVNFGDVTADANAWKALAATGGSIMVSLKNGGGLRASVGSVAADGTKLAPSATDVKPSGGISQLDIENALRFDNKLMVFDTTAQGLKNILEYGTTLAAGNGGYAQLGGVRVAIDPTKAAGSKVTDIALVDLAGNQIAQVWKAGAAVADAPSTISVVALNFTANGGDGYPIKTNATNFRYLLNNGTLSKAADPTTDLTAKAGFNSAGLDDTGSNLLGEQKAFQDYLSAFHATPATAYGQADTAQSGDERIENLSLRSNVVFGVNSTGTDAADTLNGSSTNDVLNGGGGNDSITAGGANDTIDGGAGTDTANFSAAQSTYRLGFRDGVIVVKGADGIDQVTNVELLKFGTAAAVSITALQGGASDNGLIYANINGKSLYAVADAYTGPVAGLVNQFLGGAKADNVLGTDKADFINALGGEDGINGGSGNDVIDGGLGSNFITGGAGVDKFFVDGRGAATASTWSTITDFSAGETLTIWGYKPGVSKFNWLANDGVGSYKGVTMQCDLDGNGLIDTSVTWSGLTQAQLPTQSFGSVGGNDYILFG